MDLPALMWDQAWQHCQANAQDTAVCLECWRLYIGTGSSFKLRHCAYALLLPHFNLRFASNLHNLST